MELTKLVSCNKEQMLDRVGLTQIAQLDEHTGRQGAEQSCVQQGHMPEVTD